MTDQGGYGVAALALTLFGVTVPGPAFVGGLMLAVGMCFAVMMVRPLSARRSVPVTLLMGALAGVFAALLNRATGNVPIWGGLPIQAQMGLAGLLSQGLFEMAASRADSFLGKLADKAGVPPEGEGR